MRKKYSIVAISLIFISQVVYGSDDIREYCHKKAKEYNSSVNELFNHQEFEKYCAIPAYESSSIKNNLSYVGTAINKSVEIYSSDNYLFFYYPENKKLRFIAGVKTQINTIKGISLNSSKNEVAILNQESEISSQILIFDTNKHGNIAPKKIIDLGEYGKTIDFLDYINENELLLTSSTQKIALTTSTIKDSRSPASEMRPSFKAIFLIHDEETIRSMSIVDNKILFLSDENILIFNSSSFQPLEKIPYQAQSIGNNPRIFFDNKGKTISVVDANDQELKFDLSSN